MTLKQHVSGLKTIQTINNTNAGISSMNNISDVSVANFEQVFTHGAFSPLMPGGNKKVTHP